MRGLVLAAFAAAMYMQAASADERYDRSLVEAAAAILAARMDGSLRGSFALGVEPALQAPAEKPRPETRKAPRPGAWHDGLAIAVERKSSVSPEL